MSEYLDEYIIVGDDGSVTAVAEGIDIFEYVKIIGGTVVRRDEYVPPPYVPTPAEYAQMEMVWRAEQLAIIARQLEAIEEDEADVPPPDLLPGTRKQWLKYRGQVSNWNETNVDFPDVSKRPVKPT